MNWRTAFALLAAGMMLATAWMAWEGRVPLVTDLLAMLPATERNPLAEQAIRQVARDRERQVMALAAGADAAAARRAAEAAALALRASGAFRQARARLPEDAAQQLQDFYRPYRFGLGVPNAPVLSGDETALLRALHARLANPAPTPAPLPIADDPLDLFGRFLASLPGRSGHVSWQDGYLTVPAEAGIAVLVSAEIAGSAHDPDLQPRVAQALEDARQAALAAGGRELPATGLVLFAAAAQEQAKSEVNLIGNGALLGSILLLWLAFGSFRHILLAAFLMGFGVAAGVLATLAVDGELHLLTLVCGASLLGVVIDYAIHYFAKQAEAGATWQPVAAMRALLPGLGLGLATTLLGFAALWAMPFPGLRQMALFSSAGLVAAFAATVIVLPRFCIRPLPGRHALISAVTGGFGRWEDRLRRRPARVAAAMLLLLPPGWWLLQHQDDIRLLVAPPPALDAAEARIHRLTGFTQDSRFFLVEGANAEALLRREEALTARLGAQGGRGWVAVSGFVPSRARQAAERRLWKNALDGDGSLARALDAAGFRPEVAAGLSRELASQNGFLSVDDWLAHGASTPWRSLWLGKGASGMASVVLPQGRWSTAELSAAAAGLPGISLVDKPASVSRLMGQYRQGLSLALFAAVALALLALVPRYGWSGAFRATLPCLLSIGITLALLGYLGMPVTLFHWLALILVFGLSVDYGIFVREGGREDGAAFLGIVLAAITTLLAYGLLALSSTPALAGFGLALFVGVCAATLLAPLALPPVPRATPEARA